MEPVKALVWSFDDLERLNVLEKPAWVYRCSKQRLLWANTTALKLHNQSLESFTSFSFSKIPPKDRSSFHTLNTLLREEVEVGGLQQVLSGFGHAVLPGVVPHAATSCSDVLYQPIHVLMPGASSPSRCTLVQLGQDSVPTLQGLRKAGVRSHKWPSHGWLDCFEDLAHGTALSGTPASACVFTNIMQLFDGMLTGREVALEHVEQLQASLLKGGGIALPASHAGHLSEEPSCNRLKLDQDVGLNLLQLLGSRTASLATYRDITAPCTSVLPGSPNGPSTAQPSARQPTGAGPASGYKEDDAAGRTQSDVQGGNFIAASLIPAMEAVLTTVDDWRFDAFKLSEVTQGHPLSALGFWLMKRHDIISRFSLDGTKLARFLRRVEDGYPDNPYHNKMHAAHVLQGMHVLLTRGGLQRRLGEDMCSFAGYMAAIMHDFEHRGLNNDFLVREGDELALTYNDASPMENHHVAAVFKVLRNKDYNFMRKMPRDRWVRLRRLLIDTVLATDMKQHFNILSKFQSRLQVKLRGMSCGPANGHAAAAESPLAHEPITLAEDDADKSLILQVGLKLADVGHLAAPWDVHYRWVSLLEEEFFRQGDREKARHLMVSPLMDRSREGITKSQAGFFDIVALPLFHSWVAVFQDAAPLVKALEENCSRWRSLEAARMTHAAA